MPRPTFPATALLVPLLMMGGCASKTSLSPGFEKTLSRNQQGKPFSTARNSVAFQGEPDLSTAHPANLAGTLHYCLQSAAMKDADRMPPTSAGTDDMAYNAGKQGILQALSRRTGEREQYALPSMPAPLRQTVCTAVALRLGQTI